jgi:nucleotide-binding universal stress UspA family protein
MFLMEDPIVTFKDIQVYADNDSACENRILSAVNLSVHFGGHLTGLYSMRKMPAAIYPGVASSVAVYDAFEDSAIEQYELAKKMFQDKTAMIGLDTEFLKLEGELVNDIAVQSRYADLLVIPQKQNDEFNLNMHYELGNILLHAACPVLLMPDSKPMTLPPQSAMVAWDGSRESAMALRASLPMLRLVGKVDLVSVSLNVADVKKITSHINRHGIEVKIHSAEGSQTNAGKLLLDQAVSLGSDILVMGAYGHSRLREMVLGGATKYMLKNATMPIIFAH